MASASQKTEVDSSDSQFQFKQHRPLFMTFLGAGIITFVYGAIGPGSWRVVNEGNAVTAFVPYISI